MAELEIKTGGLEIEIESDEPIEIEENEQEEESESRLEFLIDNIDKQNIAEDLDEDMLMKIAIQVVEDHDRDDDSMSDWANFIDAGQDLARQDLNSKSEPWEGASNYKTGSVVGAAVAFGDRAATELLREKNLVKSETIGPDPQGIKRAAGERLRTFSNWQINHDMVDYRIKQKRMLYMVGLCGLTFKKTYYDTLTGKNCSEIIQYPNFVVNKAVKSLDDGDEFTHALDISYNQLLERQNAGIWLKENIYGLNPEADEGSNAEQEVDEAYDNTQKFLEQNCWYDIDGDGYAEPYTVTVHMEKRKVMRIVARYDESSIFVRDGKRVRRLKKDEPADFLEMVRIEATNNIVKYGFVPDPNGSYLDLGYYHLMSSLAKTINGTTNQLMDSGTLANLQGGYLGRGIRKKMGDEPFKPGMYISTDIAPQDLQNGIRPHAFKEPSPTLLQLNENNKRELQELSVNLDLQGVLAPNAPATTTLALIQEAMLPASARLQSIIDSMSKEFMNLFKLNALYVDPEQYQIVVDDPDANFEADFNIDEQNMLPTANPEMSSRMQRIAQADAIMSQLPFLLQTGADTKEIILMWLGALGAEEIIDKVFPTQEELTQEQQARQQQQQAEQQRQDELLAKEMELKERDMEAKEAEVQLKFAKIQIDKMKTTAEIEEIKAKTIKLLEEAETEQTKNQIDKYTAELDAIDRTVKNVNASFKSQTDNLTGNTNGTRQVQS